MIVHLVDGTYELYRQYFGQLGRHSESRPYDGVIGVLSSTLQLIEDGASHIGVASDHVIESFRNELWPGYKTSKGVEPEILRQIPMLERALSAMGVTVWPMSEFEADDALASAVRVACEDRRVHQVQLLTPDKDLCQCVSGRRVVQVDRKNGVIIDEDAVRVKFGIGPESIVDYLALVGDSADGFPGLAGWGAKSASAVLAKYVDVMSIPHDHEQWAKDGIKVRGAAKLSAALRDGRTEIELFRILATLVDTVEVGTVDDWKWVGPLEEFRRLTAEWGVPRLADRADSLRRLK